MTKSIARRWYRIKNPVSRSVHYLVFAENEDKACELLGTLRGESDVEPMTWQNMEEITGCVVPVTLSLDDVVTFFPVFHYREHAYCMMA